MNAVFSRSNSTSVTPSRRLKALVKPSIQPVQKMESMYIMYFFIQLLSFVLHLHEIFILYRSILAFMHFNRTVHQSDI